MTGQRKAFSEKHNLHPLDPHLMATPSTLNPVFLLLKLARVKIIKIEKRFFSGLQYNLFHRPHLLFQFLFTKLQGLNFR
jgi:hypothetical protein